MNKSNKLSQLLNKRHVFVGEGYLFALEKMGYCQIGPYVPMACLTAPDNVKQLSQSFVDCGSDTVLAFTYYGHRTKMDVIGQGDLTYELNNRAMVIAKDIALKNNKMLAGGVSNSTIWDNSPEIAEKVEKDLREQIDIFSKYGVDYIIGETFNSLNEAKLALKIIQEYNLESVITFAPDSRGMTIENITLEDACLQLAQIGATCVGLNCWNGPSTMLDTLDKIIKKLRSNNLTTHVAGLPVGYNTTNEHPTIQQLTDRNIIYMDLEKHTCTRYDASEFAKKASEIGVKYLGTCCGFQPYHLRSMVEELGYTCNSSNYSPNVSKHFSKISNNIQKDACFK